MTVLTVKIEKIIHAPLEKVFDAWLDKEMLSKFMVPCQQGVRESDVETDAREGGGFTIIMHVGDADIAHTGKYLEISRPDRLVFTWASRYSVAENSTVTLNFTKVDDKTTKISLSHVRFIDEEARAAHEGGWRDILDKLNEVMN
jgi:uncharacterized protein YndB with AHSA1/START domain